MKEGIKIEKGMYEQAGKEGVSFSELLDRERPSKQKGLDAFQFALAEKKINLNRSKVEDFYRTNDDSVLFPEFINRNIRIGLVGLGEKDVKLEDLVATETTIDSGVYQSVKAEFETAKAKKKSLDFMKITEGAAFPTVTMKVGKSSITLSKIGLKIDASYEVIRRMKLPIFSVHMQLIGKRLAKRMAAYAVSVLLNGDGNQNAANVTTDTLAYANLLKFSLSFDDWEASSWFCKKDLIENILLLDEFKDTRLFDTARTGAWATPFGNELKKLNWNESTLGDNQIFQVDKSSALELVKESGAELVETDAIIDKQIKNTVISQVMGFSKIFDTACNVFEIG